MAQICGELFTISNEDTILGAIPLFHPLGQIMIMHTALWNGASILLQERFDTSEIVKVLEAGHISVMVGVPAMYMILRQILGKEPRHFDNLRLCFSGGGYLPPEEIKQFEELFGAPVLEGYGTTESLSLACCNYLKGPRKRGSVGYPLPEVEMKIIDAAGHTLSAPDVGEIAIKGHNVASGYCYRPEESDASITKEWLHTGDLGYMDEEGYFYFLDRKEDVIMKGGFHVYPKEIEDVLLQHELVVEAAVIGVPDSLRGEEIKGCIVISENGHVGAEELKEFCQKNLPLYKCPKDITFYKELPKGSSGKVLKKELRANYRASHDTRQDKSGEMQ